MSHRPNPRRHPLGGHRPIAAAAATACLVSLALAPAAGATLRHQGEPTAAVASLTGAHTTTNTAHNKTTQSNKTTKSTFRDDVPAKVPAATTQRTDLPTGVDKIRITQANMLAGDQLPRFNSDRHKVLAGNPDFITYNEVPRRQDDALAPPSGYELFRTPGQYKGEAPVAWRTDRWTPIAHGTYMVSDRAGRLSWQHVDWGIRYANWVTLQDAYGRKISVVAAHVTPLISITQGLPQSSVRRLGELAATLGEQGPVLIAGDFNFHYRSSQYPAAQLTEANMVPTYDTMGAFFPTGDHHGNTIDYVFVHQDTTTPQLQVIDQFPTELYSDHDAVTADLAFTTPAVPPTFSLVPTTVVNDPSGDAVAKRKVVSLLTDTIDNAPAGGAVHLVTKSLTSPRVIHSLDRAVNRGVHVQLILRHHAFNDDERHFVNLLGKRTGRKDFATLCSDRCHTILKRRAIQPTTVLVSSAGVTRAVRIKASRAATPAAANKLTTARVSTSQRKYDTTFRLFFRLVGHTP
ncbi:MAG: endonuclease/exonuclease/phosphatase family protein [Nocardioides sp.]